MKELKEKLEGDKLTLIRHTPKIELAEKIFISVDKNRDHLREWLDWVDLTKEPEDIMRYLFEVEEKTKKGREFVYGIYLQGKIIGSINIFGISKENKSGEIGYWLDKKFCGRGYMTQSVKILEKECFEELELERVQIRCDLENLASASVAEKAGYTLEGVMRNKEYKKYFREFRSMKYYAKLKEEYFK